MYNMFSVKNLAPKFHPTGPLPSQRFFKPVTSSNNIPYANLTRQKRSRNNTLSLPVLQPLSGSLSLWTAIEILLCRVNSKPKSSFYSPKDIIHSFRGLIYHRYSMIDISFKSHSWYLFCISSECGTLRKNL